MKRLLFKRFKYEVASQMSHEVFNIACEDEDWITKHKILVELSTEDENNKAFVRGITLKFYSYHYHIIERVDNFLPRGLCLFRYKTQRLCFLYINGASVFLSPSLISRRKNPFKKLMPHSHGMKVLTHFNIPVCKEKTFVLSTIFSI